MVEEDLPRSKRQVEELEEFQQTNEEFILQFGDFQDDHSTTMGNLSCVLKAVQWLNEDGEPNLQQWTLLGGRRCPNLRQSVTSCQKRSLQSHSPTTLPPWFLPTLSLLRRGLSTSSCGDLTTTFEQTEYNQLLQTLTLIEYIYSSK